jgi:transcriptional regulator with XRE-family HTH domain
MSPQHLSEIESSKRDPRLSSVERIADAMGLTLLHVPEQPSAATPGRVRRCAIYARVPVPTPCTSLACAKIEKNARSS